MHTSNHPPAFSPLDPRYKAFSGSIPQARLDAYPLASHSPTLSNLHGLDSLSPVSTDFNYPFANSPHGSSNGPDFTAAGHPASLAGMVMPAHHRPSIGSMSSQTFPLRSGSIAESDHWSPHSSQLQGQNNSEDSLPRNGWSATTEKKKDEDDRPPPWSELKTKAGKERKRLPLACIVCRRKKIRCSGEKPACKHCMRARIPCVYKVTTRKAAPRTDYMAMLDKRLRRMEERVIKVIPKDELPDTNATGRSSVRPPIPGTAKSQRFAPAKKRSADEAFVHELNEWTEGEKAIGMPDTKIRLRKQAEGENRLFTEGANDLPPTQIQEHLVEVFFDCVYGQSYLLLHKPSFMRKLKSGAVPPVLILAVCAISARFSTHPQIHTEPAFLRGEQWATPARKIVEKRHYEPNITILTVMLILGLHFFGTCEGGLSWSFGGQAMRMAYALQLHKELDHDPLGRQNDKNSDRPPQLSFTDREIRRRTMWASFLMDTFNSSGTGRPSFGNEDYMQIQLPIKESYFQMEVPGATEDLEGHVPNAMTPGNGQAADPKDNMGVAAYVIRAVVMWRRIVKYLNLGGKEKDPHSLWDPLSQFASLKRQVKRFKDNLPEDLVYNEENLETHSAERVSNQFLYLHLILTQCTLFLNRFSVPTSPQARPPKDMPPRFLKEASQQVMEAANQISQLIDASAGHNLHAPFAGYCAYAASTVQVYGLFSKNSGLESSSKENLRHNYKYLDRMKKYWGMFHYMAESVKEIYRHFADAAIASHKDRNQGTGSSTLTPDASRQGTPMFQYGDWFDKYPHGVNEDEWEDGHHEYKREQGAEAVMSQRSDLQSVEEFFAGLNPPSKADENGSNPTAKKGVPTARKVPRKRGKSVAENANASKSTASAVPDESLNPMHIDTDTVDLTQLQQAQSSPNFLNPSQTHTYNQQNFTNPIASPTNIFQSNPFNQQQQQSVFDLNAFNTNFGSFADTPYPLNQLDRQIVFGAYAGHDPATTAMTPNALSGFWDGSGLGLGGGGGGDGGGLSTGDGFLGSGTMGAGMGNSAWFMPFNMEPPQFTGTGNSVDLDSPPAMAGAGSVSGSAAAGGGGRVGSVSDAGLVLGSFDGGFGRTAASTTSGGGREREG